MQNLVNQVKHLIKTNNTSILCAAGVSGTVSTAYLTGKATWRARGAIEADEAKGGISGDRVQRLKERTQLVWKLYIPAGLSGAVTIGCIVGSTKIGNRRAAAAIGAYSVTERAFAEYRDKVVDQIGENKERKIRDEIAQDAVDRKPSAEVIIAGDGEVLCFEVYTGRYFKCDMQTLKAAVNEVNFEMMSGAHYFTLAEFYYKVGLDVTQVSTELGWDSDRLMELNFTTTMSTDERPCIAFDYNYIKPL